MMHRRSRKPREWSQALLQRAEEFHGHGGPFMLIGLRIGLLALRRLDSAGWFDIGCEVGLRWRPPDSCVIDGIQISTGCTMGKHNIVVRETEGISALFTKVDERLRVALKQQVLDDVREVLARVDERAVDSLMARLTDASDDDLFEVDRSRSSREAQ